MPAGTSIIEILSTLVIAVMILAGVLFLAYRASQSSKKKPLGQLSREEIKSKKPEELLDHVDGYTGGKILMLILLVLIIVGSMIWEGIKVIFGF